MEFQNDNLSVIGYSDLGTRTAQALTHFTEILYKDNLLEKVYCRGVEETNIPQTHITTPIPLGNKLPKVLTGINRFIYKNFDNYELSNELFDYFTSKFVTEDQSDSHFHYTPGYKRCLKAGREEEKEIIVRGSTEVVELSDKRYRNELDKFNISIDISPTHRKFARKRKWTLYNADIIIALSEFVRNSYLEIGMEKNKISVVPLGIDSGNFPPKNDYDNDEFNVLYVGNVNLLKGIPYLVRAWHWYGWDECDNNQLHICGRQTPEIKPILDRYPCENISMPGVIDPLEYYWNSSVFVFPSLTEGFAKAPLEAMSTGTPVILSENSGTNDIIEDGVEGFIIPTSDPDAINQKLKYFKNNPTEIERMGKNARETAEEYSWNSHTARVMEILNEK